MLCGVFSRVVVFGLSVMLSWYVYRCVVSVAVMRILLFLLHVCMLRECERMTEMLV